MSDDLIDRLSQDLKPVRTLDPRAMWGGAAIAVVLAAIYIYFAYGPRLDVVLWLHGHFPRAAMVWFKPLAFLLTAAGALWAVADLSRPQGRLRTRTLLPLLGCLAILCGGLMSDFQTFGMPYAAERLHDPMILCMTTIFFGGMAGLLILWRLWLRRAATSHPVALGAMSGLATACLMAAAYAVHCDRDAPVYILAVYGVSVAVTTGVAALLGKRFLRW